MQPKPTADRATPHDPAPTLVNPWAAVAIHLADHGGECGPGCRDLKLLWARLAQHRGAARSRLSRPRGPVDTHIADHVDECGPGCRDLVALWGHVIQHMRAGL